MQRLPRSKLDTNDLPFAQRYDEWRDSYDVVFGYERAKHVAAEDFRGCLDNVLFEQFMFSKYFASAGCYERGAARIARDGVDMVMLSLCLNGNMEFQTTQAQNRCTAGEIIVVDFSRPFHSQQEDKSCISVCLPRATLLEQMSSLDNAHQHVLQVDAAMPRILVAHMHSLYRDAAHLSNVEATVVGDMTVALVVAALQSAMGDLPDDNTALRSSMRMRANDAIESLLRCPELSPAMIAAKVPCSRTRLFALFSDDGGVAQYILRRRLHHVLRDLIAFHLRHYSISSIAYDWGFSNIPSFNRAFRAEFDMTPGAARQDAISLRARHDRAGDAQQREQNSHTFESWVMNLLTS